MTITSTRDSYGSIARVMHWGLAAVIVVLLATGLLSDELPKPAGVMFHKALGILALFLALARLGWWAVDRLRPREEGKDLRALAARLNMLALAGLSVVLPITGWLMSSAAGKPISLFGLMTVPPLLAPDKGLAHLFKESHEMVGNALIVLLLLHLAGALYHHFILKDDVLLRMSPHPRKAEPHQD